MSDRYWINDDPRLNYAKVHREDCVHCIRGRQTRGPNWPGGWIGPFPDRKIARIVMFYLDRKHSDDCAHCKPSDD